MKPFDEKKRDPLITEEAYQECLACAKRMFTSEHYIEDRNKLKENKKDDLTSARRVSSYRAMSFVENPWVRYSSGDPMESLREHIQYAFDELQRHDEAFPNDKFKLWEADTYYYILMLTSWAVMFNLPDRLKIIAECISHNPDDGEDNFIHILLLALGIRNFPGKEAGLLYEDPYGILYEVLSESKEVQQKAMKKYLKRWYKSKAIRGCYWREVHLIKPSVHLGYWAFEAGLITILNNLDDSSYRDMDYYPRDMVDYCRAQGWDKETAGKLQAFLETCRPAPQA